MFKFTALTLFLVFMNLMVLRCDNIDESICKMNSKKAISQLREKYREPISNWKNLQKRACIAKTSVKEAEEGLNKCLIMKVEEITNEKFKKNYKDVINKCMKKIAPIKDICNKTEQKERIYCFVVEWRTRFSDLCLDYIKDKPNQEKFFTETFKCIDQKLSEKKV